MSGDEDRPEEESDGGESLQLSNIRSLDDTGTTSLTSFLTKPVPRKRTPLPRVRSKVAEAAPPTEAPSTPAEAAPPTEASSTPTPPEPPQVEPASESRAKERSTPLFLGIGLVSAALLAIVWVGSGAGSMVESEVEAAGEAETETEAETGSDTTAEVEAVAAGVAEAVGVAGSGTDEEVAEEVGDHSAPTDPAADLAPLAVLPVTPPEILSQNTWARRNRAAEIRAEARSLYGAERWEEARDKLLLSLQWDPTNTDAQRNVSRTYQQMREMEQALSWSRRAIATDPSDPRSHELLGDQLLMLGHRVEALAAYRAGLSAAPDDARLKLRVRRLEDSPQAVP